MICYSIHSVFSSLGFMKKLSDKGDNLSNYVTLSTVDYQ